MGMLVVNGDEGFEDVCYVVHELILVLLRFS